MSAKPGSAEVELYGLETADTKIRVNRCDQGVTLLSSQQVFFMARQVVSVKGRRY